MKKQGYVLMLGQEEYMAMLQLQEDLNQACRENRIPDTILFLQHYPCYTTGRKGGSDHILVNKNCLQEEGITVYETDRGGDITYHGPGQLVCYPILNLKHYGKDVHHYARLLEAAMIATLAAFDIQARSREGYPGVWVGPQKIGFMGITINQWVTMHGISLNVCPDMQYFSQIIPCGLKNVTVTSMAELLRRPVSVEEASKQMRCSMQEIFDIELQELDMQRIKEVVGDGE